MTKEKLLNILEDTIEKMEEILQEPPSEATVDAAKVLSELIILYKEINGQPPIPGKPELLPVKPDAYEI